MTTQLTSLNAFKAYAGVPESVTDEDTLIGLLIPQVSESIERSLHRIIGQNVRTEIKSGQNVPALTVDVPPVQSIPLIGTTTQGSATVTGLASTAALFVNQSVIGPGIPTGAIIGTIASATSVILTNAAGLAQTATASATVTLFFGVAVWDDNNAMGGAAPGAFAQSTMLVEGVDYWVDYDSGVGSPSSSGILYNANSYWFKAGIWVWGLVSTQVGPPMGNVRVQYSAGYPQVPASISLAANLTLAKIRASAPYGQLLSSEGYEGYSYSLLAAAADSQKWGYLAGEVGALLAPYRILQMGVP